MSNWDKLAVCLEFKKNVTNMIMSNFCKYQSGVIEIKVKSVLYNFIITL